MVTLTNLKGNKVSFPDFSCTPGLSCVYGRYALLVTSPRGVTLWTKKHWRLALFVFASVFKVAIDFFRENWFLFKGRNDVTLSQT